MWRGKWIEDPLYIIILFFILNKSKMSLFGLIKERGSSFVKGGKVFGLG